MSRLPLVALLALVSLLGSPALPAAGTCKPDLAGTNPTAQNATYPLPTYANCPGCRELNRFPEDFAAAAWNYAQFGAGELLYKVVYQSETGTTTTTTMPIRICGSRLGQCATTVLVTEFEVIDIRPPLIYCPFPMFYRKSVKLWRLVTYSKSGTLDDQTIYPGGISADPLYIPLTPTSDGYKAGIDCLYNDGRRRT